MRLGFSQSTSSLRIIASAILLFATGGCGNSSTVGKWRMGGSNATIWEFKSNAGVLVGDVQGRYKFGDQARIKIETPFATTVYVVKISHDQLILQEPGGSRLEFCEDEVNAVLSSWWRKIKVARTAAARGSV